MSILKRQSLPIFNPQPSNSASIKTLGKVPFPQLNTVRISRCFRRFLKNNGNSKRHVQIKPWRRNERTHKPQLQEQHPHPSKNSHPYRSEAKIHRSLTLQNHQIARCKDKNVPFEMDQVHAHKIVRSLQLTLHLGLHLPWRILVSSLKKQKTVWVHRCHVSCYVHLHESSSSDQINCQLDHASLLKISSTWRTIPLRISQTCLVSLLRTEKSSQQPWK